MVGRGLDLENEEQGWSLSDYGATSWTLCYFLLLSDRQCFPPSYWVLQFTQEIKLTNDRSVREKAYRVYVCTQHAHTWEKLK